MSKKGLTIKKFHNKNGVKICFIDYLPKSAILLTSHRATLYLTFIGASSVLDSIPVCYSNNYQ